SVFVTARSACFFTFVVAVAVLFPGLKSVVADPTVAVFVIVAPSPAVTLTTSVKLAVALRPNVEIVQLIAPLPPTIGVRHVHAAGEASETNVVPGGIRSPIVTAMAASGPAFATWMRYVRFAPGATGSGEAVFVIDRSACGGSHAAAGCPPPTVSVTAATLIATPRASLPSIGCAPLLVVSRFDDRSPVRLSNRPAIEKDWRPAMKPKATGGPLVRDAP